MRVEALVIHRTLGTAEDSKIGGVSNELKAWRRLFGKKYRDRTMIGVLMMVFQRALFLPFFFYFLTHQGRMGRYQCFIILRPYFGAEPWLDG
jgi:hypothetical protein